MDLPNQLPNNEYLEYFGPDFNLHPEVIVKHENANSRELLDSLVENMHRLLKMVDQAPSVQMQVKHLQMKWKLIYLISLPHSLTHSLTY